MSDSITWAAGLHWAYSQRAWCGFFRQDADGLVICRHELSWYEAVPEDAADDIKALMAEKHIPRLQFLALDPAQFPALDVSSRRARVITVSSTFSDAGLPVKRGHEDWKAAWSRVRSWLAPRIRANGERIPTLRVHKDCEYLIRTLAVVVSGDTDPDLADIDAEESIPARAVSYYVMARPMPARIPDPIMPPDAIGHEVEALRAACRENL